MDERLAIADGDDVVAPQQCAQSLHPAAPREPGDDHGDERDHAAQRDEEVEEVASGLVAAPLDEAHVVHEHQAAVRPAHTFDPAHREVHQAVGGLEQALLQVALRRQRCVRESTSGTEPHAKAVSTSSRGITNLRDSRIAERGPRGSDSDAGHRRPPAGSRAQCNGISTAATIERSTTARVHRGIHDVRVGACPSDPASRTGLASLDRARGAIGVSTAPCPASRASPDETRTG